MTLRSGRIYILPTSLGSAFGLMLFAMLLGSLNYGNNLGLALTFFLSALGVVAMHACHRNLEALVARAMDADPPFAGKVNQTHIGDDDAFAVRTQLRLNIGLGSSQLYQEPIK